ncbi:hypothetical protein HPB50_019662 [Hyalomma asiaticum]|uniref:Uncharacterized protein n=1 Tax=Hyalomma asiaticum TaxID=266040 RepID=A0ACB7T3B9_HYAAI|nr:hypothetical protein HPB50_019662 [Hyalomma asiaticum]
MDITVLRKEELLLLAAELGMDINSRLRKPEIRAAIEEVGFEEDELTDAWEKICRERNERAEEKEKQEKREQRQAEIELERIKLEQARLARSADAAPPPPAETYHSDSDRRRPSGEHQHLRRDRENSSGHRSPSTAGSTNAPPPPRRHTHGKRRRSSSSPDAFDSKTLRNASPGRSTRRVESAESSEDGESSLPSADIIGHATSSRSADGGRSRQPHLVKKHSATSPDAPFSALRAFSSTDLTDEGTSDERNNASASNTDGHHSAEAVDERTGSSRWDVQPTTQSRATELNERGANGESSWQLARNMCDSVLSSALSTTTLSVSCIGTVVALCAEAFDEAVFEKYKIPGRPVRQALGDVLLAVRRKIYSARRTTAFYGDLTRELKTLLRRHVKNAIRYAFESTIP